MAGPSRKVHVCCCAPCRQAPRGATAEDHRAINRVLVSLDERGRRLFAGLLAQERGHGGVVAVAGITGLSRTTIRRGLLEMRRTDADVRGRVRRSGGGRKRLEKKIPA
jgi:hypothetical protein